MNLIEFAKKICRLPHCSCATPFNINFEPDNFTSTGENFKEAQHIQTYSDIHENHYDEIFYSSTSESGGDKNCE